MWKRMVHGEISCVAFLSSTKLCCLLSGSKLMRASFKPEIVCMVLRVRVGVYDFKENFKKSMMLI